MRLLDSACIGALLLIVVSSQAVACSGAIAKTVKDRFMGADLVFLGRATEVKQELLHDSEADDPNRFVRESAVFVVEKGWKNAKMGDRISFTAEIGPGLCGTSALNDPGGIVELIPLPGGGHSEHPIKIRGLWLVYAFGPPPYSMAHYSLPIEIAPEVNEEQIELDRLTRQSR